MDDLAPHERPMTNQPQAYRANVGHKYWMRDPNWDVMQPRKQEWLPITRREFYRLHMANYFRQHRTLHRILVWGFSLIIGVILWGITTILYG